MGTPTISDRQKPAISVVIPVFNGERFIAEAIQSVSEQRFPAAEIVVVDDGSSDGTESAVRGLSSPIPIRYLRQENQGPSAARNLGVSLAKGDWIAFLDADDVWYPNKLDTQVRHVQDHPRVVLFWSDLDYIDESGRLREPKQWNDTLAPLMFNHATCPCPSTVLIKKDAFVDAGGFNPMLRCGEDAELFMRVAAISPIQFIPCKLAKYRCHSEQLHRSIYWRAEGWPVLYRRLSEMWREDPRKQSVLRETAAAVYADLGKYLLRAGRHDQARQCFRQCFALKPYCWKNLRRWGVSYLPFVPGFHRLRNRFSVHRRRKFRDLKEKANWA